MTNIDWRSWIAIAALWCAAVVGVRAGGDNPVLRGVATDISGAALPGVTVVATRADGVAAEAREQITDGDGRFAFDDLTPGRYAVVLSLPGFSDRAFAALDVPASEELRVTLEIATLVENVVVRATADPLSVSTRPAGEAVIAQQVLREIPLATERFEDALPMLPGVVRGPDGLLNMNGARADQSAFLLNGVNMADPVTGYSAVRLPIDAIEALNVHAGVHSAAYGSATGAVTDVIIRPGQDAWDFQVQNFLPRLRFDDGQVRGLSAFTPRLRVSGPLSPGRVWVSQAATYRFVRTRVDELGPLGRSEQQVESFNSVTQIDARASDAHHLTATAIVFPSDIGNAGITTLRPFDASPDLKQRGFAVSISDRAVLSSRATLATTLAARQYDMDVEPKGGAQPMLTVLGARGRYFNRFDRESTRYDASSIVSIAGHRAGEHLTRAGGQFARTRYSGLDSSSAVSLTRADGSLLRQIDYLGTPGVGGTNTEVAAFVEDAWSPGARLTIQGGVRYGYDHLSSQHTVAPRINLSLRPFNHGRTVIKGGIGRLYDKLALNAGDFEQQQSRRITNYGDDGQPLDSLILVNRLDSRGLRLPRSTTRNIEIDQMLAPRLLARVGYRDSRSVDQLIVTPLDDAGVLLLSSSGRSRSREFEGTIRRQFAQGSEVTASYVRAVTRGDLNAFVTLFGDLRDPIIQPNECARQPFDVPHRFLIWGVMLLPYGLSAAPTLEYRTGFPFTVVDEAQRVVGARNEGGRFPDLFTLDLALTKDVKLTTSRRARVGVQVFNLTGQFNPQDVQNNLASPLYGLFANSVERQFRLKFTLLF